MMLMAIWKINLVILRLTSAKLWLAMLAAMVSMMFIRGEISMAPITTAVLFTFKPTEAMSIENIRIYMLGPVTVEFSMMRASIISMDA